MKGDIPAAIALVHLDPASRQRIGGSEHMDRLGVTSQRNDGRMFQQQQHVADLPSLAQIDQFPLQAQPFAIFKLPELDDRNQVTI